MGDFDGIPVKCQGCGGWFHELTRRYSLEGSVKGSGLRLLVKYQGCGWYDFPHEDWVVGDNVQCPQCMRPYSTADIRKQAESWVEKLRGGACNAEGGPAATAEVTGEGAEGAKKEGPDDGGLVDGPPEMVGEIGAPVPACFGGDCGLNAPPAPGNVEERVRQMTWDGRTQTEIAETCQISVYRVRQIQNGKGV
jgi:hypothetical protein